MSLFAVRDRSGVWKNTHLSTDASAFEKVLYGVLQGVYGIESDVVDELTKKHEDTKGEAKGSGKGGYKGGGPARKGGQWGGWGGWGGQRGSRRY